jgi:hypothetical protein
VATSYKKLAEMDDEDVAPKKASSLANIDDEPAPPQEEVPWYKKVASEFTLDNLKRQSLLATRAAVKGASSLPLLAMDMGVSGRNMLTGENYQMPSEMFDESMDSFLPKPESTAEKITGFAESVLAGSRIPVPQAAKQAPIGFSPQVSPAQTILKESQDAGYVVPPATAAPNSIIARGSESVAGKLSTAQAASVKNQEVTNELVRKALNLQSGAPITEKSLEGIRESAGKVYAQIANAGEIVADAQYIDDLATLGKAADEIAASFPGANVGATKQISELQESLLQDKFDSKAALQYLRELRKMASGNLSGMNAADPAKQALGMAQREAAATLEDLIGRHLVRNGMDDVANSFAGARKTIAMTHTVEKALNEATGNVSAVRLGQDLAKGKPLSGELEVAARFARAFPKAAREINESMPGASPLDWLAAIGVAGATGDVLGLSAGLVRPAVRGAMLSAPAQKMLSAAPKTVGAPQIHLGMAPSALLQAEQQ